VKSCSSAVRAGAERCWATAVEPLLRARGGTVDELPYGEDANTSRRCRVIDGPFAGFLPAAPREEAVSMRYGVCAYETPVRSETDRLRFWSSFAAFLKTRTRSRVNAFELAGRDADRRGGREGNLRTGGRMPGVCARTATVNRVVANSCQGAGELRLRLRWSLIRRA